MGAFDSVHTQPDLTNYRPLGPLYWKPALFLRDVGYDDNVFLTPDANASSDITATVAPEAEFLWLIGSRAALRASQQLSYTSFSEHQDQNFFASSTSGRADLFLNRWSFYTDATHLTTRVRPNDEIDLRPRRINQSLKLGARLEHQQRLALELYAVGDAIDFRDDEDASGTLSLRDRLTRTERAAGATLAYRIGRRTDLLFEAEARDYDFSESSALTPSLRESRLGTGLDWRPRDTLKVRLVAGSLRLDPDTLTDQSFDGLAAWGSVEARLFERLLLRFVGSREPYISSFANNLYAMQTSTGLRAITLLTRRLRAEVGADLNRARYSDPAQEPERRLDVVSTVYGGAIWRVSEKTQFRLRVTRYERNSNLDDRDRSLGTISGALEYLF